MPEIDRHVVEVCNRSVYGRVLVYPVSEAARLFAGLIGSKSISPLDLALIEALGHKVVFIPDPEMNSHDFV